jgi:hypothetical protein
MNAEVLALKDINELPYTKSCESLNVLSGFSDNSKFIFIPPCHVVLLHKIKPGWKCKDLILL